MAAAVEAFADAVEGWAEDDPRRVRLALARLLARRLDEGDDWRMSEHLVSLMTSLAVDPSRPPNRIDDIRAQGAAREIKRLALSR